MFFSASSSWWTTASGQDYWRPHTCFYTRATWLPSPQCCWLYLWLGSTPRGCWRSWQGHRFGGVVARSVKYKSEWRLLGVYTGHPQCSYLMMQVSLQQQLWTLHYIYRGVYFSVCALSSYNMLVIDCVHIVGFLFVPAGPSKLTQCVTSL